MSHVLKRDFTFEVKEISKSGRFTGYGSVFGEVDSQREVVEAGAFAESIKAMADKGRKMPILWQHDWSSPLGTYASMKEDEHGLLLEGQLLVDSVAKAKEAYALVEAGAVTGLSIGYVVRKDSLDESEHVRRLLQVDLKEVSLVTFPSNDSARVESIKQVQRAINGGGMPSLSQFERLLSDSGFTRKQALFIANNGLKPLLSESEEKGTVLNLASIFDQLVIPTVN